MGIFGNKKSEKSEPPARLFLGTSGELAAIGKAGFGVAGGSFPGISLVDMDRFVVPAYEQAGYPELGTPEFFKFQSSFISELESEAQAGGGWAYVAAAFVAVDFLPSGTESQDPGYRRILREAAVQLRDERVRGPAMPPFLAREIHGLEET